MITLVAVVVASALTDGGTAIALDDGTVWLVHDGDADELGACDDGDVQSIGPGEDDALVIACGDGTQWTWDDGGGWQELAIDPVSDEPTSRARSWWPVLDVAGDQRARGGAPSRWEGWIRLRWDL